MTRRIKRDEVMSALWGGSVIKHVVITGTLTSEQRKAMEAWLVSEARMWLRHDGNPLVYAPDATVYSYVVLPQWDPAALPLKYWWNGEQGVLVDTHGMGPPK